MKTRFSVGSKSWVSEREFFIKVVVLTVTFGVETHKLNVMEFRCSQSVCGVTWMDRLSNEKVKLGVGVTEKVSVKADQKNLNGFVHVEIMIEERLTERVFESVVDWRTHRDRSSTR